MKLQIENLCAAIDAFNERAGQLAAWLLPAMAALTFLIVALRYGFSFGRISLQEAVTYLHACVFMLGGAYTLKHNGHVRIDIFYQGLTPRNQARVDFFGTVLLLLPCVTFIICISLDYVFRSWAVLETSREAGGLPFVYLLKTLIPAMAMLLLLQAVSLAARAWLAWRE